MCCARPRSWSRPARLLVLLLPVLGGCKKSGIDGVWQCKTEEKKKLDLDKVRIPYTIQNLSRMEIAGSRLEIGEGKQRIVMTLDRKAQHGPRHYLEATVSAAGLPIKLEPVAFEFELSSDGQSLTIRELRNVNWSNPAQATGTHPVPCARR